MPTPRTLLDALERPDALPPGELAALRAWLSTFYPFQREWLLDPNRFAVCNKSRQIGISHTSAACCVLWGAMLGETTTVISVGQREADEVVDKAKRHALSLVRLGSRWARHRSKSEEITFANGGRIIALPASSGGRSFSGNVFLDEFAYVQDPDKVWDGASAVTMHGYRMRVASTPNGMGGAFSDLWHNHTANRGWAKHTIPISRALADGMKVNIDDCWKLAKGDKRQFAQLFECSFLLLGRGFFDSDRVDALRRGVSAPVESYVVDANQKVRIAARLTDEEVERLRTVRIWHKPEKGRSYIVSLDPAEGEGGDPSAGIVFDRQSGKHCATIWGQFKPDELARIGATVGYEFHTAEIVVERNNHGVGCLLSLGSAFSGIGLPGPYPRVFVDKDGKRGWLNNQVSRPVALDFFEQAVREGIFQTPDRQVVGEMGTFVVKTSGRAEAAGGAHDDLILAAAIGWSVLTRSTVRRDGTNLPHR